jgi:catechol 2,3-dioxygenase-like lactoylglutathione lyase family enzyme
MSAVTQGIDHVGLAVSKLDATTAFFIEALGWKLVGERPDYPAKFVSDGRIMVTLWQVENQTDFVAFNRRRNVGLHHLALKVARLEDLHALLQRLKEWPGVTIEFEPQLLGKGPKTHMMIYEPSGNRIEFDWAPQ